MKLALHWRILIGMIIGVLAGFLFSQLEWGKDFVEDWIKPFGDIFINLLKMIAIPLILASLIKGISDLEDISKIRDMGSRTVLIYIGTTLIAIVIGLVLVNIFNPGSDISTETVAEIASNYENNEKVQARLAEAETQKKNGPLQPLVDVVPDNIFGAMSDNGSMLKVIFFTILFGISLLLINPKKAKPVKDFFDGINEVILKIVDIIMLTAPFAVFALLCNVITSTGDPEVLISLLEYAGVVVLGLALMIVIYMIVITTYTKRNPIKFISQISPAQILAFSTSSSAATLPVTMERLQEHVGVEEEVSSFVAPVGATINMDGTSLYQAVAAVFICNVLHYDISFMDQITIVFTALLASIGAAAVPGAGMVMLVIVLESIDFPSEKLAWGLALIFAVDRPLDMCRTMVNVTSDSMVATVVAKSLGKLHHPVEKNIDDFYKGDL